MKELEQWVEASGKTHAELNDLLGKGRGYIGRLIRGEANLPSDADVARLGTALGVNRERLRQVLLASRVPAPARRYYVDQIEDLKAKLLGARDRAEQISASEWRLLDTLRKLEKRIDLAWVPRGGDLEFAASVWGDSDAPDLRGVETGHVATPLLAALMGILTVDHDTPTTLHPTIAGPIEAATGGPPLMVVDPDNPIRADLLRRSVHALALSLPFAADVGWLLEIMVTSWETAQKLPDDYRRRELRKLHSLIAGVLVAVETQDEETLQKPLTDAFRQGATARVAELKAATTTTDTDADSDAS